MAKGVHADWQGRQTQVTAAGETLVPEVKKSHYGLALSYCEYRFLNKQILGIQKCSAPSGSWGDRRD